MKRFTMGWDASRLADESLSVAGMVEALENSIEEPREMDAGGLVVDAVLGRG